MAPHVTKSDVVSQEVTVTHGVVKAIVVARIVIVFLILYIIVLPVIFHRHVGFALNVYFEGKDVALPVPPHTHVSLCPFLVI